MSLQPTHSISKKADVLASLRDEIRKIEGFKTATATASMHFGITELDNAFPDKCLPLGTTHEFISDSPESSAATASFIAAILSKVVQNNATVLWVSKSKTLYAPGLLPFGITPDRIVFIHVSRDKEALWAIEEALRAKGLMAVVGEIGDADLTATRRLQLAVEKSGTTGLLLRNNPRKIEQSSVCVTRWKIDPLPSIEQNGLPGLGQPRWNVELQKVRHGQPGKWAIEWNDYSFSLIPQVIQPLVTNYTKFAGRKTG